MAEPEGRDEAKQAGAAEDRPKTALTGRTMRGMLVQLGTTAGLNTLALLRDILFANWFTPAQYGMLDSAEVVTGFSDRLARLGARQAIIRAGERWQATMRTALGLGLSLTSLVYLLLVLAAPWIADWFDDPEMTRWLRLLGLTLYSSSLALPEAAWDRELRFGKPKFARAFGTTSWIAASGFMHLALDQGADSLLWGALIGFAVEHLALWGLAPYRPKPEIDSTEARALLAFGTPLVLSGLANYVAVQGDDLMVRVFRDEAALAIYRRAFTWPHYLTKLVAMTSGVLFPAMVLAEDAGRRARAFARSNRLIAMVTLPAGVGLALFAEPLVLLVFSPKWAPAIPLFQVFALAFAVRVSTGNNWHLLPVSRGNTRPVLAISIGNALLTLLLGIPLISRFGAWGGAMVNLSVAAVWALPARLYYLRQELGSLAFLKDLPGPAMSSLLAAALTWSLFDTATSLPVFALQLVVFGAVYLMILRLVRPDMASELRHLIDLAKVQ